MKGYYKIRNEALKMLKNKLSKNLFYHGIHHTLDVLHVINLYIKREKIDSYNAKLLRIGALYHDIGFTKSNIEHENLGAQIANDFMVEFGFSKDEIKIVKGLIMATKIPQKPQNYYEKIICDADLDYLGRNDFYPISYELYKELKSFSNINNMNEWYEAQIKFLESHHYHTNFAIKNRQPKKEKRINELKKLLS